MQGRALLQPVSAALEMNPKERALYLKQKHSTVTLTDDEATVASATAAGLRSFLRQARSFWISHLYARLICLLPALHRAGQSIVGVTGSCDVFSSAEPGPGNRLSKVS